MRSETKANEAAADGTGMVELVRNTVERLSEHATVDRVYGEPITADEKTVVPVARVSYGFGGGFGSDADAAVEEGDGGEGGGIGGGVRAAPVGALEITDGETRFVRFTDLKSLALAVGVGFVLGRLAGRR